MVVKTSISIRRSSLVFAYRGHAQECVWELRLQASGGLCVCIDKSSLATLY